MSEYNNEVILQILAKLQLLEQKIENLEKNVNFHTSEYFHIKDLDYS